MKPRNQGSRTGSSNPKILVPSGTHTARIVCVAFVGAIKGWYKGAETDARDKLIISYELCNEMRKIKDDKEIPFVISKEYAFFYGTTSHLRRDVEALLSRKLGANEVDYDRPDEMFNASTLLGMPASVTVIHKEYVTKKDIKKTDVRVSTVSAIPAEFHANVLPPSRDLIEFDISVFTSIEALHEDSIFKGLNKYLKGKVESSVDYNNLQAMASPSTEETPTEIQQMPPSKEDLGDGFNGGDDLPF